MFRSFADLLEPLVPDRQASILDIGCATGGLLAELQWRGFANLLGIDPSPRCAQEAKRLYGIPVLTGSFFDLPLDGRQFDLLILTGVLEHVRDVGQMLGKIGRLLAPNGLLFIGVPDATRYMDGPNAPFQHFSMEHINYFSPTSLARLMSRHGWRPRTVHQMICNQNFATGEPFICALFQHDPDCAAEISFDNETEPALRSYIKHSQARMDRLHNILAGLATIGKPILVWGVGTHTLRLLATSPLANTPIRAFVDSNQNYQAKMLHGRPIIAPIDVKDYPEPILISSWMYQQEIQLQICKELCLPNEIILLYDLEPAENGRRTPANPD
jgi:SAM-dependent methyltransferase